jgi:hypothetical protein
VAERKSFLLRLPSDLFEELSRWSRDELRSLNAQIEYVLRDAVRRQRRAGLDGSGDRDAVGQQDQPGSSD